MQKIGQSPNTNYAMQNEFKEGEMKDLAGTIFVPTYYHLLNPCSLARFPEKIAMLARLCGHKNDVSNRIQQKAS